MSKETQTQLSNRLAKAAQKVTVGARYTHYKQPQLSYKVLNLALREEDNEPVVVYQAEYGDNIIFARPVSSWIEEVEASGKKVKRFEKMKEDTFENNSNEIKSSLLLYGMQLTDNIDKKERQSDEHSTYFGYLKDFLVNSGCLCDDNIQAASNDAVLLAMIGARTLLEDTINCYYLKSRPDETARIATATDWLATSNDSKAHKNKVDNKGVAKRADESGDDAIKILHDGEYADFCNYTHSTAQRTILNIPDHRTLAAKKTTVVSIKAYTNILTCIAEIIGEPEPKDLIENVKAYFDKYREDVMEATLV